jgi:hypothetical protein
MPSSENTEYTPSAWGVRDFDFEVPSGGKVRLRRMDPLDLIKYELTDKLDFLTSLVMTKHVANGSRSKIEQVKADRARREAKARGEDPDAAEGISVEELMKDPKKFEGLSDVLDKVMLVGVVKPNLEIAPANDEDRKEGVIYTDTVPFNDKMAIFNQLMGGINRLEQFRTGSEEAVADVASDPGVRVPRKRTPRVAK